MRPLQQQWFEMKLSLRKKLTKDRHTTESNKPAGQGGRRDDAVPSGLFVGDRECPHPPREK